MLKDISVARLIGAWCAAVIVIGACGVAAGADLSIGNGELWLVTCVVPPAIMLLLWRGAPPITITELLHSVDGRSKEAQS